MRKLRLVIAMLVGFPMILGAADAWKSKPIREWTQQETQRFFRDSPWVRQVTIGGSLLERSPGFGTQTGEGRGESAAAEGRTGPSEMEVGGGGGGTPYFIEWTSAKIVRQAVSHFRALQGQGKEEEGEPPAVGPFVVSIGGPDLRVFQGVTEDQLKASAYLRPKRANTKLTPANVRIRKTPDERVRSVQFAFPRELNGQLVISDQEKSVEFSCKVKEITLKTSFDVTKMITPQGRDL